MYITISHDISKEGIITWEFKYIIMYIPDNKVSIHKENLLRIRQKGVPSTKDIHIQPPQQQQSRHICHLNLQRVFEN